MTFHPWAIFIPHIELNGQNNKENTLTLYAMNIFNMHERKEKVFNVHVVRNKDDIMPNHQALYAIKIARCKTLHPMFLYNAYTL